MLFFYNEPAFQCLSLFARGRNDIAEKNKKNLERYQNILNTIKQGNIIFGRLERIKRKQGVSNG